MGRSDRPGEFWGPSDRRDLFWSRSDRLGIFGAEPLRSGTGLSLSQAGRLDLPLSQGVSCVLRHPNPVGKIVGLRLPQRGAGTRPGRRGPGMSTPESAAPEMAALLGETSPPASGPCPLSFPPPVPVGGRVRQRRPDFGGSCGSARWGPCRGRAGCGRSGRSG
eukprot:gene11033-biopygen21365